MTEPANVIAIDGPVGVGKSSVAAALAAALGWRHLDTGAMYRAVALAALRRGISPADAAACGELARSLEIDFLPSPEGQRVLAGGEDVTEAIRTEPVNRAVSSTADHPEVRAELGRRQRAIGEAHPSAVEGRDMGTVVFPGARWKFFLDADPLERARRRRDQLAEGGRPVPERELLESIAERDRRDRERPSGALRVAPGAVVIDTTRMSRTRVVALIEHWVRGDLAEAARDRPKS